MTPEIFKYILTGLFVFMTFYLSYIGMKKTKDLKGFSIGNKDMSPYLIGMTMAASISSTATFVINPGFVYQHGLSAYMHFGVAALLGITLAFILITKRFRAIGEETGSLTIPDWIFHRYGSRGLSLFFAFANLLSITFIVLILVGSSILMGDLFDLNQKVSLTIILLFVFSYVLMGGTYAHAYTNTFQGIMMTFISIFLFISGLKYFSGGFISSLETVSMDYASVINTSSSLYYDTFSVFVSGFFITFALMFQPHILTKVLYIKSDKDVNKFIGTTIVVGLCFGLMLFIGFYARLKGLDIAQQDTVVSNYIISEFSASSWGPYFLVFVTITLLAAGMSTLDGILVSLSAMVVNDIYYPLMAKNNKAPDQKKALWLSRFVLVCIGLISYLIAFNPPQLVGLFAQKGVYGLAAASFVPVLFGVLIKKEIPVWIMSTCAISGLVIHLVLNIFMGVKNPAVSSCFGILFSITFFIISYFFHTRSEEVQVEA